MAVSQAPKTNVYHALKIGTLFFRKMKIKRLGSVFVNKNLF